MAKVIREQIRELFDRAYGKFGAKELANLLDLTQSSISAIRIGRQSITPARLQKLCRAMGDMSLYEAVSGAVEAQSQTLKAERDLEAEVAFRLYRQLNAVNRQKVRHFMEELEMEEQNQKRDLKLEQYFTRLDQNMLAARLMQPDSAHILDAVCCFGREWISRHTGLTGERLDDIISGRTELTDHTRHLLVRYLCAAKVDAMEENLKQYCHCYFAYGSNMNTDQMLKERCPGAMDLGGAVLRDYELRERRYADIDRAPGKVVHGVLYRITDEHLSTLDRKEGRRIGIYDRHEVEVEQNGTRFIAWVYELTPEAKESRKSQAYAEGYPEKCSQGAKEHQIPDAFADKIN